MENDDKGYEVKDKRRVNSDGTLREGVDEEPEAKVDEQIGEPDLAEPEATDVSEPGDGDQGEGMFPPDVYSMLQFCFGVFAEQAWVHMGIRLGPGKKELTKDLVQAKIAIDMVTVIADKLHASLEEENRRIIRSVVSDLQINFVRQSS